MAIARLVFTVLLFALLAVATIVLGADPVPAGDLVPLPRRAERPLPPSAQKPGSSAHLSLQPYRDVLRREARSPSLCESVQNRIFVRHQMGTDCIAYIATTGRDQERRAVVFIDGDLPPDRYSDVAGRSRSLLSARHGLQRLSDTLKVRFVRIARLGLDGSSGNHANRRKPREIFAMSAAIDVLKAKLGLDEVVLAGQSRGSMIAASLLTLGRRDVSCAVLGSGVFEHAQFVYDANPHIHDRITLSQLEHSMYDPSHRVEGVARSPSRRIFVVGDVRDLRTHFDQQERFARALSAAGHHTRTIPVTNIDALHHGSTRYVLPIAALCARNVPDERIIRAAAKESAKMARAEMQKDDEALQKAATADEQPARDRLSLTPTPALSSVRRSLTQGIAQQTTRSAEKH